jgi:carbamoyl-phosphate synthase/aspartate carbamoyltransferase/dihydroorotase
MDISDMSALKKQCMTSPLWTGEHVLSCDQFDEAMLHVLFETASAMKAMVATKRKSAILTGRVLANIFYEPSTRTMCSFDAAMKRLGGDVISVSESSSSAKKGETIEDTVRCLECYCDILVLRHPVKGTAAQAASAMKKPLINAGDGVGEHPTQALLDLFTVVSAHPRAKSTAEGLQLDSLTLTLLGDLKHGRTVHSIARLVTKLSRPPTLHLVSPALLSMPAEICDELAKANVPMKASDDFAAALPAADVLYVTRVQKERFATEAEYAAVAGSYVVNAAALAAGPAKSDMLIMHPLPRVDEISTDVDADPRATYFIEMENGMYVRMALLALVLGADLSAL